MFKSKKTIFILLFSFVFVFAVSALSVQKTEFVITTDPYQNLSFTVVNPDTNEELQVFAGRARKFGEYRFTYYGTISKIKVVASIINNATEEIVKKKEFGPFTLGTPSVNLNFSLSDGENAASENNLENLNANTETNEVPSLEENSPISGAVVGTEKSFSSLYYIVAAVVLCMVVLIFLLKRKMFFKSGPNEPDPKKLVKTDKKSYSKTEVVVSPQSSTTETIGDTEKKIVELQKQLEQIRSEEKLLKLQQQIDLEKKSLNKLHDELRKR